LICVGGEVWVCKMKIDWQKKNITLGGRAKEWLEREELAERGGE
jgi:hypothetical protein